MTDRRTLRFSFGPEPYSLDAVAELVRRLGPVDGTDLAPLAESLDLPAESYQVAAVADLLGLSDDVRELPELYAVVRRVLEKASESVPVKLAFENARSAGPAFHNLVAYLSSVLDESLVTIEIERGGAAPVWPTDAVELRSAGLRHLARSDMPAAHAYLTRAAELFPSGPDRLGCIAASCDALLAGDRPDDALRLAESGLVEATAAGDERYRARFGFFVLLLGDTDPDALEAQLGDIAAVLEEAGDAAGAAQAVEALGHLRAEGGEVDEATTLMDRGLGLARSAGDKQTATRIAAWICDTLAEHPVADEALARVEELAWIDGYSPLVQVKRLVTVARIRKRLGDLTDARGSLERAVQLQSDLGQPHWVAGIPESGSIKDL